MGAAARTAFIETAWLDEDFKCFRAAEALARAFDLTARKDGTAP